MSDFLPWLVSIIVIAEEQNEIKEKSLSPSGLQDHIVYSGIQAQGTALGCIVYFLTMDLAPGTLQSCRHRYRVSFVPFSEAQVHKGYINPNRP